MNIYFDMEFTGLHQHTTPISIGAVSEDKHYFYAEFIDYDELQVNDWIRQNVINNLKYIGKVSNPETVYTASRHLDNPAGENIYKSYNVELVGTRETVAEEFKKWIHQFGNEEIQFVSDVCSYDFVLLCEFWGGSLYLPHNIVPFCKDVNQMIGDLFLGDYMYAFNLNREEFIDFKANNKHNSKHDAIVIKKLHSILQRKIEPSIARKAEE